jgi:hypothetical protein
MNIVGISVYSVDEKVLNAGIPSKAVKDVGYISEFFTENIKPVIKNQALINNEAPIKCEELIKNKFEYALASFNVQNMQYYLQDMLQKYQNDDRYDCSDLRQLNRSVIILRMGVQKKDLESLASRVGEVEKSFRQILGPQEATLKETFDYGVVSFIPKEVPDAP